MEVCGIAAIDLDNHTAMHLEAVQTLPEADEKLLGFYAKLLTDRKEVLQRISNIVVVDAYFSKETFVTPLCKEGFDIVSRLRDDVRMTYLIEPVKTSKRGRTKTVGDKVDVKNLDLSYFSKVATENHQETIYTAVVKATALKRNIRVVIVHKHKNGKPDDVKIYFSTDTAMSAEQTLEIYRTRFQIEFLYRDAKQHTGLTNCQARSRVLYTI